jgi:hypothetical protein
MLTSEQVKPLLRHQDKYVASAAVALSVRFRQEVQELLPAQGLKPFALTYNSPAGHPAPPQRCSPYPKGAPS